MATSGGLTNPVSLFMPGMAETQVGLSQIERQRQMAQMLQSQAYTPITAPQVNGITTAVSPFEYLGKMLQGYTGGKMQESLDTKQLALSKALAGNFSGMFGSQGTPAAPSASSPAVQSALSNTDQTSNDMGMPSGGPGPTTQNASNLAQAIQSQPQAASSPGPLQIPGMSTQDAMARYMAAPDAYMSTLMSQYKPTDAQLNAQYANPGDPNAARTAIAAQVKKAGYIPPTSLRPGGFAQDSSGNLTFLPKLPEGVNATMGQGGQVQSVSPIEGNAAALQANAQAQAIGSGSGKAPYTPLTATGPNGQPITLPLSQLPGIGTPVPQQPSQPQMQGGVQQPPQQQPATAINPPGNPPQGMKYTPADTAAQGVLQQRVLGQEMVNANTRASGQYPTGKPVMSNLGIQGQTTAEHAAASANEQQLAEEAKAGREASNVAVDTNYNLQHALTAAQGFETGKLAPTIQGAKTWLQAIVPADMFSKKDMDGITNFAEFNKYGIKLGFDQARKMGARESTQIVQMAIESNPNSSMVGPAVQSIGHGLMAQNDYVIAKEKARDAFFQQNHQLQGFNSQWQASADPLAFLVKYQTPEQQATMFQRLDTTSKAKLLNSLKQLRAAGAL